MNDALRWYLLEKKRTEERIQKVFRSLRREGIEPVLIKGWAAARNYPSNVPRFSLDIDIAVSMADFPAVRSMIACGAPDISSIDLHPELRELDTVAWDQLIARSELVDLEGEQIRLLAPEDHLRVLCTHWLINGGANRERLLDIVYAVRNRPPLYDWNICVGSVSENRRGWVIATIGLAHRYMDLDISDLPFASEAANLPRWLTEFLEKEWHSEVVLWPLDGSVGNASGFFRQLRKRMPPNPIQATVNCEGRIDDGPRWHYQVRDAIRRSRPSVRKVFRAIRLK